MRKNLFYTALLLIFLIVFFANYSYAKDYSVTLTDRSKAKQTYCVLQKNNGNRMLICSESDFELSELIPIKKLRVETPKPSKKASSSFEELLMKMR